MRLDEVKKIAKQHNIKTSRVTKAELVRAIQLEEGNSPCFATKTSTICGQDTCLWRGYCD